MKIRRLLVVGLAVVLGGVALAGCTAGSAYRTGWVSTTTPGEMTADYAAFDGDEEAFVRVEAGETLHLAYAATVDKGALTVAVLSPADETLWETRLTTSTEDRQEAEVVSEAGGRLDIRVTGEKTGGDFALSWTVD